ncbi:MAG: 4-hydroxy-tetrahydrodipicolinate synthase [Deltaproteobacteria bacterium]|nr:4-hydroxy-tetrahydrodipicolinate synthase [Deltaproteobacteria bacterium]
MSLSLSGVHTALITPFREDGSVDFTAYERLCQRQVDAGVHGLVVAGTTGEAPTLTEAEYDQLVRIAVGVGQGVVPVTAGVGTNNTVSTVAKLERAAQLGANAGLLVFPYYNKPNPRGLRAHVAEADKVGLPFVLYHVPGRTGQRLPAPLLAELAQSPGVIAIKEATGDIRYGGDLMARTDKPVLSGDDFTFLSLLAMGGAGVISVLSNVAPVQTVEIWDAWADGDTELATQGMYRLWDLIDFLFTDSNPVPAKAAMAALGLSTPTVRLPLGEYSGPSPAPILAKLGMLG